MRSLCIVLLLLLFSEAHARDAFVSVVRTMHDVTYARILGRSLWNQEHANHPEPSSLMGNHQTYAASHEQHLLDSYDRVVMIHAPLVHKYPMLPEYMRNKGLWSRVDVYSTYAINSHTEGIEGQVRRDLWHLTQPLTLTEYDRVMYIAPASVVHEPLDELFECVGHTYDLRLHRERQQGRRDWFRWCAFQRNTYIGLKEWNVFSEFWVATPSDTMQDDILESALWLASTNAQDALGRYLFWQCEDGNATSIRETVNRRAIQYDAYAKPMASPRLWQRPDDPVSVYQERWPEGAQRWPMSQCRCFHRNLINVPSYESTARCVSDASLSFFDDDSWKPLQWQSWLLSGAYDEWRAYNGQLDAFEQYLIVYLFGAIILWCAIYILRYFCPRGHQPDTTIVTGSFLSLHGADRMRLFVVGCVLAFAPILFLFYYWSTSTSHAQSIALAFPWTIAVACTVGTLPMLTTNNWPPALAFCCLAGTITHCFPLICIGLSHVFAGAVETLMLASIIYPLGALPCGMLAVAPYILRWYPSRLNFFDFFQ